MNAKKIQCTRRTAVTNTLPRARAPIAGIIILMIAAFVLSVVSTPAKAASVPGVPMAFTVVSSDGVVTLAWSEPADDGGSAITGYRVYRGMMEDGLGIVEDVTEMHYTDTGISSGQTYYYAVSALNAEGEGVKTDVLSIIPEAESPLMTMIVVGDYTTFVIINVGEGVYFDIAGGSHSVVVTSITGTRALITISSDPQKFTMSEGDSENVDVNDDGTDDFKITCKTINSVAQTVEFSFTKASKKSGSAIPGFELWTMVLGGLLAFSVLRRARAG